MRSRYCVVTLAAILFVAGTARPADDKTSIRFKDATGTFLAGTVTFKSITVRTEVGVLVVPIAKLKNINFCSADSHWVNLVSGDVLNGKVEEPKVLEVVTELGPVKSEWSRVANVYFPPDLQAGAQASVIGQYWRDQTKITREPAGPPQYAPAPSVQQPKPQ